jgi:alanine racemase
MMASSSMRPTWAEVSRDALRANYRILCEQAARANGDAVAVIKANAYGHGATEALPALADEGSCWFAVTCLGEALLLQPQLKNLRTLILSGLFEGEAEAVVRHAYTPVLGTLDQVAWLAEAVPLSDEASFPFHLEIDTGMARQGIQWNDTAALSACAARLARCPQLRLEAVMTHFSSPEDPQSSQTAEQLARLRSALATLREQGIAPPIIHAGNSASLFELAQIAALREIAQQSGSQLLLRPGIALYGYGPQAAARGLQPLLSWKTRIAALREIAPGEGVSYNATFRATRPTRIALLPVGYADGYNRLLSNRGEVLVRGRRARIAGRVTMDQTMIDVTDIAGVAVGDEVALIGAQNGDCITADDLAAHAGTIAYEVLCSIGQRVPRVWI